MADEQPTPTKKTRGEGKLAWLSQRKDGELIEYQQEYGVPIDKTDENAKKIVHYVGKLAKDGENFPFDEKHWRKIDNIKQKINEALEDVKSVFKFHEDSLSWFRETLNTRWRQNKGKKKARYFDPYTTEDEWFAHCPPGVIEGQWQNMVAYWQTKEFKELSVINKSNKRKHTIYHKAGSKSYLNHGAQIEKETGKRATRTAIYKRTHQLNPLAAGNIRKMVELENEAAEDGMCSEEDGLQVEGDIYSKVMGADKKGKIRGVGTGVKASMLKGGPSRNVNPQEVQMLREEVSELREERQVLLTKHQKDLDELKLEMKRELQKTREEMNNDMQAMLRVLVQKTTDKDVTQATTSNQN